MGKFSINYNTRNLLEKCIILKLKNQLKGPQTIFFQKSIKVPTIFIKNGINIYKGCYIQHIKILKFSKGYILGSLCFTRKPFCYLKRDNYFNKLLKR